MAHTKAHKRSQLKKRGSRRSMSMASAMSSMGLIGGFRSASASMNGGVRKSKKSSKRSKRGTQKKSWFSKLF